MRIVTVTLNPAVDKYLYVDSCVPGDLHRVNSVKLYASGKGVNVSLALLGLGVKSDVIGLVGGEAGNFIKQSLQKVGLKTEFCEVPGETRTNIKLIEVTSGRATEFNEPGPTVSPECAATVIERILDKSRGADFVVLSGSVPSGFSSEVYGDLVRRIQGLGAKAIVDASGEVLKLAVAAKPFLIKPNRSEAEELVGYKLATRSDFKRAAMDLLDLGVQIVIISDGPAGAIFVQDGEALWASHAPIAVVSPFGCGDALVAGFVASLVSKTPFDAAARFSLATATAAALSEGTSFPPREKVEALLSGVVIEAV